MLREPANQTVTGSWVNVISNMQEITTIVLKIDPRNKAPFLRSRGSHEILAWRLFGSLVGENGGDEVAKESQDHTPTARLSSC